MFDKIFVNQGDVNPLLYLIILVGLLVLLKAKVKMAMDDRDERARMEAARVKVYPAKIQRILYADNKLKADGLEVLETRKAVK